MEGPINEDFSSTQHFKCNVCKREFNSVSSKEFLAHIRSHVKTTIDIKEKNSKNEIKTFDCHVCMKIFPTKDGLRRHILSMHKQKEKFRCDVCDKSFSHRTGILQHKKFVHRDKSFQCNKCEWKFTTPGDLKRHIERIHVKIKDYECKECNKEFFKKTDFNNHLSAVHEGIIAAKCGD